FAQAGCSGHSTTAHQEQPGPASDVGYPAVPSGISDGGTNALPGRDLLRFGDTEHAAALLVDDTAVYVLLVSSDSLCQARWISLPKDGSAAQTTLWTGSVCQLHGAAQGTDVVAWATYNGASSTLMSVPKAGGTATSITTVPYIIASVAVDESAYYWTNRGSTFAANPSLGC